jgi:hypothetical protein
LVPLAILFVAAAILLLLLLAAAFDRGISTRHKHPF